MFGEDVARTSSEARSFGRRLEVPPRSSHRLVRLADALDADVREGRASRAADLIELRAIVDILSGLWDNPFPWWHLLRGTLRDPAQFDHQILVVATVRVLRSWKNATDLVPEGFGSDLVLHAPPVDVAVEVKAPRALTDRGASGPIYAGALVEQALRSSRHQRRGRAAALVVHAGFRVPHAELNELEHAWASALADRPTRASIAAGIAITVGLAPGDIRIRPRPRSPATGPLGVYERFAAELDPEVFRLGVAIRVGRNPTYAGSAPIIGLNDASMGIRLPR